jgi:putative component of membrane protein insertase Oxa1/YidC/SpoIIIJ protein YidD
MKFLILIVIKLYWMVFPEKRRRFCLFKETCSHYVYRHTAEGGFFKGTSALLRRFKKCRKGYQVYSSHTGFEMELADGSFLKEDEIAPRILEPIYRQVQLISGLERYRDFNLQKSENTSNQ